MDSSIQRLLSDKLYDRRKAGALELESAIRNALNDNNHDRIAKIVHQLCHDFAYAVHQPHARNGGLIGLAAAAIALGPEVARHLKEIVPPVLACFSDQDARVRYYACESMYNIAKVAKGEILVYFNDVFDALCKLAADTELSVKNGAELLDRLVKDIVSESAANYASILVTDPPPAFLQDHNPTKAAGLSTAFSLPKFIPLLQERINVLNPFTRTFLVSWITLLDSIPDLELVAYLPSFLGGLLRFLSDPNQDVHTTTKVALDRFLVEIKKISTVKKGIAGNRKSRELERKTSIESNAVVGDSPTSKHGQDDADADAREGLPDGVESTVTMTDETTILAGEESSQVDAQEDEEDDAVDIEDEWTPGQDVHIDYQQILAILVTFLSESDEQEVQITTLKWVESFLNICPEDILVFTPRLLAQVLPALSDDIDHVKHSASRVNQMLMSYIVSLPEDPHAEDERNQAQNAQIAASTTSTTGANPQASTHTVGIPTPSLSSGVAPGSLRLVRETNGGERQVNATLVSRLPRKLVSPEPAEPTPQNTTAQTLEPPSENDTVYGTTTLELDYEAAVNALTQQFLHEHEATRVAALAWLIMLHRKSPRRILAIQDATFPALLKTLSDPAEAVVTRDLLLLSQISKSSDDSYFSSFMINLLRLFQTDRRLLEARGNLIIRQLCLFLSAEKIYRIMADTLDKDEEDIEFASIMVQNLNNNLLTAPELQELRKRLRNLDTRDGQTFFTVLFRAWCVNAVATFSLCLLAQAYEQAYNLLQIFAELEMTVTMLIQIDKLVQLLESPVFTYLRMQLLEPERFPHLYKCLYGLLMLLPQSSAFAALKNRLNSVSAIGYLHTGPRASGAAPSTTPSSVSTFERQNRLKGRSEEGSIRWNELLEKFKNTQELVRRSHQRSLSNALLDEPQPSPLAPKDDRHIALHQNRDQRPASAQSFGRPVSAQGAVRSTANEAEKQIGHSRQKSGLSQLGRLATGRKARKEK